MIIFAENIRQSLASWLQNTNYDAVFVLVDSNTRKHCLPLLAEFFDSKNIIEIPAGEENKNLQSAEFVWSTLAAGGASRKSVLINLGGGMVTDLGGFCASVYQRGIDFIHIPTTLMAMVDAAIGGKTGIDFRDLKNYIGTFQLPKNLIIGPEFLQTLPKPERLNGWAEMLKHAVLAGKDLWIETIEMDAEIKIEALKKLIPANIAFKNSIVNEDATETGLRKILNFGHTLGHAIETLKLQQNQALKHGLCVCAGMQIESIIALNKGLLLVQDFNQIQTQLNRFFSNIFIAENEIETLIAICKKDKKNAFGHIKMALPAQIGQMQFDIEVSESVITQALQQYISRGTSI